MSIGNWSMLSPAVPGQKILTTKWNSEFQNVINNCNPDGVGTASETVERMQEMLDPYPSGHVRQATSLRQEIQQLRYQFNGIIGDTDWYKVTPISLSEVSVGMVTGGDDHDHTGVGVTGGGALIDTEAIADEAITTEKVEDEAITTEKVKDEAITTDKVANEAITIDKIDPTILNSIQYKHDTHVATTTTNSTVHMDVVPPPDSDGDHVLKLAMTPTKAGNIFLINYQIQAKWGEDDAMISIVCVDNEHYSLCADIHWSEGVGNVCMGTLKSSYAYTTTSTDERTFTVRCGTVVGHDPGYINFYFGAATSTFISITEIET